MFTFCVEKSYDGMHLAFGGTFGAAISNTFHSNKAGSAIVKRARLTEAQGRGQCCHNKHEKFPYWPTCDVSLLSGHSS